MARSVIITLSNSQHIEMQMHKGTEHLTDEEIFEDLIGNTKTFVKFGSCAIAKHHVVSVTIKDDEKEKTNE